MKEKNKTSLFKKIIKTLPMFLGVVFLGYLVLLIESIEFPTMFPVNEVNIVGELRFLDKSMVEQVVKDNITGGYFTVDLNNVRDILMQQAWLKDVSLRRRWPATLNIFIEEQVPIAYWNDDSYVSENGNVFAPESIDRALNLPALRGPEGQHENVWQFMNILYKEMALLEYEVVRLNLDNRRAWQLEISGLHEKENSPISVKLGRFDTEKRMLRFIRLLPALTADNGLLNNKIKIIDMRYPNGFAVQMLEDNGSKINAISRDFAYQQYTADMQISGA